MTIKYEANKKWRLANPEKRYKDRDKHYKRHMYTGTNWKRYSPADEGLILTKMVNGKKYLDREIAALIGRSLKAIHVKRTKLKSDMGSGVL